MKRIHTFLILLLLVTVTGNLFAQGNTSYWQQHVDYTMDIDMDVENYQYKGTQKLVYTNNSPDELHQVFYHLYYNAFQPGSEMSIRSINLGSKKGRVYESKIEKLQPHEIGYLKVISLKQNGKTLKYIVEGTVLEVELNTPVKPGEKVTFDMIFEGQLPVLINRAGRNSSEGVALSMSQWYPKMAEYDFEGWQAHPYIGNEFYGVWGNFDVTIHIDKTYTIGGTGYLQNPQEIGHGYEDRTKPLKIKKGKKLAWHFIAPKVNDFTWAADPDYVHDIVKTRSGTELHFLYKNKEEKKKEWKEAQPVTEKALNYFNEHIGKYPYKQYSVIQGGDGGMEYAMCTLIPDSGIGTIFHELAHSWFQHILATNESKHAWMDEGFASYIGYIGRNKMFYKKDGKPSSRGYGEYFRKVKSGKEEPLTTHADRFNTNSAYKRASYTKGSMFLTQLNYIIGEENVKKTIKKYYEDFKFKHPTPNDIKRTAEKVSGIQLDWYLNEWIETTHTIDYAIKKVEGNNITLARIGRMPMPIDVTVSYIDGSTEEFNIPLRMMRGEKPTSATILKDWAWAYPTYSFTTTKEIKTVEIDKSQLMADVNRENNKYKRTITSNLFAQENLNTEADFNAKLFSAIDADDVQKLSLLITKDTDLDKLRKPKKQLEQTLLQYAAYDGRLEVVKFLVGKGADIGIENEPGRTALDYAFGLRGTTKEIENFLCQAWAKSDPDAYIAFMKRRGKIALSSEDITADLDQLQKILETESSYLHLKGLDYKTAIEKIKSELKGVATITELGLKLEKLIGSIGDRHSKVKGFSEPPKTHALPFALAPLSGKDQIAVALLKPGDNQYKLFLKKYPYLKSIDNMGLTEVIDKINPRQQHAPKEAKFYRGLTELKYISKLYFRLGKPVPEKIAFTFSNGKKEKTVLLSPVAKSEKTNWYPSHNKRRAIAKHGLASKFTKIEGDIGYIRIPKMWKLKDYPNLFETFNQEMSNFKDTRALIIDIRNNGGGERHVLAALEPYFMAPGAPSFVANMAKVRMDQRLSEDIESMQSRYLYDYDSEYLTDKDRKAVDLFMKDFKEEWDYDRDRFSDYYYMVFNHDKGKGHYYYDKPVYILVNERSFSAASVLTTALNGLGKVKIAGIRTDGSSGRSRKFYLKNSGLEIKLSTMISFQRNGKTLDTNGTLPDIEIERDMQQILGNRDSQLEELIKIIENQ